MARMHAPDRTTAAENRETPTQEVPCPVCGATVSPAGIRYHIAEVHGDET